MRELLLTYMNMGRKPVSFDQIVTHILKNEGGWVDNPIDHGGATNYGITQDTLSLYLGRLASKDEVKNLSDSAAKQIYRKLYWEKYNLDSVNGECIALALFDQIVNRGPSPAIKDAQKCCGAVADGVIGPKTIALINHLDQIDFLRRYAKQCAASYINIVKHEPLQMIFLSGWINRTYDWF